MLLNGVSHAMKPNILNRFRFMKIDYWDNGHTRGNHYSGGYRCCKGVSQNKSPPSACPIPSTPILDIRFTDNMVRMR